MHSMAAGAVIKMLKTLNEIKRKQEDTKNYKEQLNLHLPTGWRQREMFEASSKAAESAGVSLVSVTIRSPNYQVVHSG